MSNKKHLPAKSQSKGIQRRHIRRYKKKSVVVNPDVKKPAIMPKRIVPRMPPAPISRVVSKGRIPSLPRLPAPAPPKLKVRWQSVLKKDRTIAKIEDELKRKGIILKPGEIYARKIIKIEPELGYNALITFIAADGEEGTHMADITGTPTSQRFMALMEKKKKEGKPMILHIKESKEPEPVLLPTGQPMGFMMGTIKVDKVRDPDTNMEYKTKSPLRPSLTRTLPDGRYMVLNEKGKMRIFKDFTEYQKARFASSTKPTDIFGEPWETQTKLTQPTAAPKMEAKEIFKRFRENVSYAGPKPKIRETGKLKENKAYELIKGERFDIPGKTIWTVSIVDVKPNGAIISNRDESNWFPTKARAEQHLKNLKKKYG